MAGTAPFHCRKKLRRRHALLLEVLIAFLLVALCATPLLRPHVELARREKSQVRDLELELYAREALEQVRIKLFEHAIAWKDLDDDATAKIALEAGPYPCSAELTSSQSHDKSDYATYRLVDVQVNVDKKVYHYELCIERNNEKVRNAT